MLAHSRRSGEATGTSAVARTRRSRAGFSCSPERESLADFWQAASGNLTRNSGRSRAPSADGALAKFVWRLSFPLNPRCDHMIFDVRASGRLALDADLLRNMWLMSRPIGEVEDE